MQKEIIIVIVIIIAIFSLNAYTNSYTEKNIGYTNEKLDEIKEIAEELKENNDNSKQEELESKLYNLKEEWNKINLNMSFYIEHDELEKVNTSMIKMSSYMRLQEYTEAIPELENCKYILQHIIDKESTKIINFF